MDELKLNQAVDVSDAVGSVKLEKRHSEKKNVDYIVAIIELVTGYECIVFLKRSEPKLLLATAQKVNSKA